MRILLTGFMGSGKTTVGRLLAEHLEVEFYDLDEVVEASAGIDVREIFENRGEAEFRRLEWKALTDLLLVDPAVIATGGGTLAETEGFERLPADVVTVWLDAPLDVIERRLQSVEVSDRPLYRSPIEVENLYRKRLPRYQKADLRVGMSGDDSETDIVERVIEALREKQCAIS